MTVPAWRVFADADAVADAAAAHILDAAHRSIARRGRFALVLAGGGTPVATYRRLRDADADWSRWHVYQGDERCLPADDPGRNSVMARQAWLDHVPLPAEQVFPIPAEEGPERAAARYREVVTAAMPFDLVLLGMGEDGHTASLFPGRPLEARDLVVAVRDAPKPPPERVSLGLGAINGSREALILVTGGGKRDTVRRWRAGEPLPVARVNAREDTRVYIDAEAFPGEDED